MTIGKLDLETNPQVPTPASQRVRNRDDSTSNQATGESGVTIPPTEDVVSRVVESGGGQGVGVDDKARELERRLAGADRKSGQSLALIDQLMGLYAYQAKMAVAIGDVETAELVAQMAGGMVGEARVAVADVRGSLSGQSGSDPAVVQRGRAELARAVQGIALKARTVADIAGSARIGATSAPQRAGGGQPADGGRLEAAIASLVAALHDGSDADGVTDVHAKTPSVIVSTVA